MQTQDQQPDFIPVQASGPDFIPLASTSTSRPPAPDDGNPFIRFIKAAAAKAISPIMGGPVEGSNMQSFDPQEYAKQMKPATRTPLSQIYQNASLSNLGENAIDGAKALNPIATDRIQSGDVAGGLGETATNFLNLYGLLRGKARVVGSPAQYSEFPQSLGNYQKVVPQPVPKLLNAAPSDPIPLGPSSMEVKPVQREGLLPAKSQMVSDGQGGLKKQFLTSVDTRPPLTNYTLDQAKMIQNLRAELETPRGTSMADQQAVDQRMAEYARTPWENETPVPANETPLQKYIRLRALMKPRPQEGNITVYPNTDNVTTITQPGTPVTQSPQRTMSSQVMDALSKFKAFPDNEMPQVVGNGDLTDVLNRSIARARAAKAGR